jgi:hypothetical protein
MMPLWRYRVPKIARRAASGHMNGYDLENRSSWLTLITPSPVRDRSYRDWNHRTLDEHALQHSLGRNDDSAAK